MAQLVTATQAGANALKRWLDTALTGVEGGVTVYDRWPEPTIPLAPKAIAILLAGMPTDDLFDPVLIDQEPVDTGSGPDPLLVDLTYRFRCRRQPLQLSIWAAYDVQRDDLCARLDLALNSSDQLTLGTFNADPVRNGLTLPLAAQDGWSGVAEFLMEGPELDSAPDKTQQQEFTATYRGYVDVMLTQTARTAKLAQLALRIRASESTLPHAEPLATTVVTITDTGAVITREPKP